MLFSDHLPHAGRIRLGQLDGNSIRTVRQGTQPYLRSNAANGCQVKGEDRRWIVFATRIAEHLFGRRLTKDDNRGGITGKASIGYPTLDGA